MFSFFLQSNSDVMVQLLHRLLLSAYGIIGMATIIALLLAVLIGKLSSLFQAQQALLHSIPPKN